MEQLKPSEEAIIKLGKKLVKELDLEYSVNTLARWMAHYLAELIEKIEKAEPNEDKKILQQECCDVILKIWSQKENLPIKKPLDDLRPIIEILEVLKEKKETSILPRWIEYRKLPRDNQWASFVDLVKNNSERIFSEVLQMNLHKDILCKDKEWMSENKEFLNVEQIRFLEFIDVFVKIEEGKGVVDLNDYKMSDDNTNRVKNLFENLEKMIDEQKHELLKIKKQYLNQSK